jgi:peptide/nickel transport system permease protein
MQSQRIAALRQNKQLMVAGLVLLLICLACAAAPLLSPYQPNAQDLANTLSGPSAAHSLGTDSLGRDVLSRLLWGGQPTLIGLAESVIVAVGVGLPVGLLAGYLGGLADSIIGRIADLVMAIPAFILLLVVVEIFPQNVILMNVVLGLLLTPPIIRVARTSTFTVRNELHVDAAKVAGLNSAQIIRTEILSRIMGPVTVQVSLVAAFALLIGTGLAFLGFGTQPPDPSWGSLVSDAQASLQQQPWLLVPGGGIITITIFVLILLGDSIRDFMARERSKPARQHPRTQTSVDSTARREGGSTDGSGLRARSEPVLRVLDLRAEIGRGGSRVEALDGVSFDIMRGETLALAGESGCGKSLSVRALLGLLPPEIVVTGGSIHFGNEHLHAATRAQMAKIRGRRIGFISQEPMASLDPSYRIGAVLIEVIRTVKPMSRRAARERALELLESVGLPAVVAMKYPHEISGGMAQRVAIAMSLVGDPEMLIADEPTTALDVTVQAEILGLLRKLQDERGLSILLVTHDWGVIADACDRVAVMYAGRIVEVGSVFDIYNDPQHPYTAALLDSNPQRGKRHGRLPTIQGSVPPPGSRPSEGCTFRDRCSLSTAECAVSEIPMLMVGDEHAARCIHTSATAQISIAVLNPTLATEGTLK